MTHGIDQSASWNAATPASRDRTIFATFTASAPHTLYRELRILADPRVPFIHTLNLLSYPKIIDKSSLALLDFIVAHYRFT